MGKYTDIVEVGHVYGRPDMERLGLFAEMGYLVGKKYTPLLLSSNIRDLKRRQMFPGGTKWKTDLQDCYFNQEFQRLFIGEAYPRKRKDDEYDEKKPKTPDIVRPFVPSKYPNPLYNRGDAYGYFSYSDAFSPKQKPREKYQKLRRGIFTNPGKLGGSGYLDICINPYPEHKPEKYDPKLIPKRESKVRKIPFKSGQSPNYFEPNPYLSTDPVVTYKKTKDIYTGKIGPRFRYPKIEYEHYEYIEDRYHDPYRIDKVLQKIKDKKKGDEKKEKKPRPKFNPPACCRSWQCPSVLAKKAKMCVNADSWTESKPVTFSHKYLIS